MMKYCLRVTMANLCLLSWCTSLTAYERRNDNNYNEWNNDNQRYNDEEDRNRDDENRREDEERQREEERQNEDRNNQERDWFSENR